MKQDHKSPYQHEVERLCASLAGGLAWGVDAWQLNGAWCATAQWQSKTGPCRVYAQGMPSAQSAMRVVRAALQEVAK